MLATFTSAAQVTCIFFRSCQCRRDEIAEREASGLTHSEAKELSAVSKAHLDLLVRLGLLTRQSSDRFSFAVPGLGPLMKSITEGRKVGHSCTVESE